MQKSKPQSFTVKLFLGFLIVILFLSVSNFVSNSILLRTLEAESERSADERMASIVARFDEQFYIMQSHYITLYQSPLFQQRLSQSRDTYNQIALWNRASQIFANAPSVGSYALFFHEDLSVITKHGIYDSDYFFSQYYQSSEYSADFWDAQRDLTFTQRYYPVRTFAQMLLPSQRNDFEFMPIAIKPYWGRQYMLLLLVDIEGLIQSVDAYYAEGLSLYDGDTLLYAPAGTEMPPDFALLPPDTHDAFTVSHGTYVMQRRSEYNGLTYVKVLPRSAVQAHVQNSLLVSILIAAVAICLGLALAIFASRRFARPVQQLVSLLDGDPKHKDDFGFITSNVHALVKQQDKFLRQIAERDNALTEFVFHSQLKNVYVSFQSDDGEAAPQAASQQFFILYFKIHYRDTALTLIDMEPKQITYMIKEILREILSQQFENLLIFQLETHQFIAKVGLPQAEDITPQVQALMKMLENEEEYAFFTVVQSPLFESGEDISDVYAQVLRTAQYALVQDRNQFLLAGDAPAGQGTNYRFSPEQSQTLYRLIAEKDAPQTQSLIQTLILGNVQEGINHLSMVMLSNKIASVILRVLSDQNLRIPEALSEEAIFEKITQCDTAQDYLALISDYAQGAIEHIDQTAEGDRVDPVIRNIKLYIEQNYTRDFTMQELGETVGMSKAYLSTYFKNKTGINMSEYIQHLRIQKAVELLESSEENIQEIGAMVGIANPNTFIRLFKKYVGMSPGKYRKSLPTL